MRKENKMEKILVTGSAGQIGSELVIALRKKYGNENVIATGRKTMPPKEITDNGPFEIVDATDKESFKAIIKKYNIKIIYHLVGILSAVGEKNPNAAWKVNMDSLKNVLDIAVESNIKRIFWPSSIAAFGKTSPKKDTPQSTILEPNTMYGVTKVAGELLCNYYHEKYGLDVRSIRYPGIISYKTLPGGGTTDYAVAVYYDAIKKGEYEFFVNEKTVLPMMYMDDAIRATIELMEAPSEKISIRTSYNLTAFSASAEEFAKDVKTFIPEFKYTFKPDERQNIADSWPKTIDDSQAKKDWNWKPEFNLHKMSEDMLKNLRRKLR